MRSWISSVSLNGSQTDLPTLLYDGRAVINLLTGEPILPAQTANQYLARYWFAVCAGKIGSPVRRFITNRVPPAGGTAAPSVPIYASAAYGCALAHSPQTTRGVRATFYSRLSQYGPHAAPCTCGREGPCPHGPGGGPPALHARLASVPTAGGGDLTGDLSMPHSGVVRSRGGFDL
jgi:hypothetical protein